MEVLRGDLMRDIEAMFRCPIELIPWAQYLLQSEGWEETEYFKGKDWTDLDLDDFNRHPYCLSFFEPRAFPFFWGAAMFLSLKSQTWTCRAIENYLTMWSDPSLLKEFDSEYRHGEIWVEVSSVLRVVLTGNQIDIIGRYFEFLSSIGETELAYESKAFLESLRSKS